MPRFFFCSILLLCFQVVHSQDYEGKIDSLLVTIPNTKGEALAEVFNTLTNYLIKIPKEVAFAKAQQALTTAQQHPDSLAEFLALLNLSRLHAHYLQQTEALRYMQEGISYTREKTDSFALALSYYYAAEFYKQQKLLATSLENLLRAQSLFEALNNYRYLAACRNLAANVHFGAKNYTQAIEEGLLAIDLYMRIPTAERTDMDGFQVMSTHNTLALCYHKTKEYDKSLDNYSLAEQSAIKMNREFWVGLIHGNRAIIFREMNQLDKALESLLIDYTISKKYREYESAVQAASTIAEVYMLQDQQELAQNYLDSARLLIDDLNRFELSAYWKVAASIKKAQGDYTGAYAALERYSTLRDSMSQLSSSLNLMKVKANYELESKQREIEVLAESDQQNRDRIKMQNIILLASAVIVVLLLSLIIVYIRSVRGLKKVNNLIQLQHEEIQLQSEKLKEANDLTTLLNTQLEQKVADRTDELKITLKELDTFLYRSSHDIRRPLSTLLGLENVAKIQTQDKQVLSLFEMVGETVRNMDSMLLKLQMAYELSQQEIEFEKVPVADIVHDQVEKFNKRIPNGSIELDIHTKKSIPLFSNAKLFTIIIKNLLENAVNFRKTGDAEALVITIQVVYTESNLLLIVRDNGIGIEEVYLSKIFEQYFKGTQSSKGNGLGLYLVQKALNKLKGTIEVSSEFEKGSTFTVTLPYTPH